MTLKIAKQVCSTDAIHVLADKLPTSAVAMLPQFAQLHFRVLTMKFVVLAFVVGVCLSALITLGRRDAGVKRYAGHDALTNSK